MSDVNIIYLCTASSRRVSGSGVGGGDARSSHYEQQQPRHHRDSRDSEGRSYHNHHQHNHHRLHDDHQGGDRRWRGDEDWNYSEVNYVNTPSKLDKYHFGRMIVILSSLLVVFSNQTLIYCSTVLNGNVQWSQERNSSEQREGDASWRCLEVKSDRYSTAQTPAIHDMQLC